MPLRHVAILLHHIDRLRAEESFRHVDEVAVGSGVMEKDAATQILDGWRYALTDDLIAGPAAPRTRAETISLMKMQGVEVVES